MIGTRRRFLQVTGAGTVAVIGGSLAMPSGVRAQDDPFTWISPRGSLEVVDDYAYWVAKRFGYFDDIETDLQPGPSDGTATVKFVDVGQADMGYPSPGILAFGLDNGMDLVSVWNMAPVDIFNFAFRSGEGVTDLKALEGKTILVGSAAWEAIANPMLKAAGADPSSVTYLEAGYPSWGPALAAGRGDAALAWEGLRADWAAKGLDFEYWIGSQSSPLPGNVYAVRRSDFEDEARRDLITRYLRGWAMGMEFGRLNPRAATAIVFEQFPSLARNLGPELGTKSLMQIASVYGASREKEDLWGLHDLERWRTFFDTAAEIGIIDTPIAAEEAVTNELVRPANDFDGSRVAADAEGFELAQDIEAVDVEALRSSLFDDQV